MPRTCIMLVGDADSPFVSNEIPYLAESFCTVHVFAYNTKPGTVLRFRFPANVIVHHLGAVLGFRRFLEYIPRGICCSEPNLSISLLSPKRLLACLYARGRSDAVYRKIMSIVENEVIPIIHGVVYSYWFTDQAIVAWRVAEKLNKRGGQFISVSRAHGYDLYWERNMAGFLPYQDVSLEHLNGTFPCSAQGLRYLSSKYPSLTGKMHLARLGTCDYGLGPEPHSDVVTFVTCGRLDKNKHISLFAEAFCKILSKRGNYHWYCIGAGSEKDIILSLIHAYHADESVSFLGFLPNKDVTTFYKNTPITYFVNVSRSEGIPVSIMEALSFGIPVIATDVGGTHELISKECGRLVHSGIGAEELARAIEQEVTLQRERYIYKRRMARTRWETMASAENNYSQWCNTLIALSKNGGRGANE